MKNSKDARSLEQVYRADGKNCFFELLLDGLPYDKAAINFLAYDPTAAPGQRGKGGVTIFLAMYEAQVLSRDIMSGRIATLGRMAQEHAKQSGNQYAGAVFSSQGGTPAKRSATGTAIARVFEITPGASQPWVLCAKQGKAHETPEGLIVMDGKPDTIIRVPASNEKLKEFALAIETIVRVWEQLRFVPVAAPMMDMAMERRKEAIDQAKSDAAAAVEAAN